MDIKNNKGITLISLIIYVIALLGIIGIISTFKSNVDGTIDSIAEYTSVVPEINQLNMYMLKEVNLDENQILKRNAEGTYIEFSSGNNFRFEDNKIYKNGVRVLSNVNSCTFEIGKENNNDVLYVNLELGDKDILNKRLKYAIK